MKLLEVVEVGAELGESPLWDHRTETLYWLDIHGRELGRLDWRTGSRMTWPTPSRFGSLALMTDARRLLAATATGICVVEIDDDAMSPPTLITDPEPEIPGNRFNDGKTDRDGRFWVGTMDDAERERTGSVYRLDIDGEVRRWWGGVGVPNGVCFSPDGATMYVAESWDKTIWSAVYDRSSGEPGEWGVFATTDVGAPDGSTVDADGGVWNAEWGGHRLVRYRPDGNVESTYDLPVRQPTCPAFAGTDLDLLVITSARKGDDPGEHAGSLLIYEADICGLAEAPYRGG